MSEIISNDCRLDNLGTDIYWVNSDRDVEEMAPMVREMGALCKASGKVHHEWLQCWIVNPAMSGPMKLATELLML